MATKVKTAQRFVEAKTGRPVREVIHEMYYEKGMSQPQIAKELGVSVGSVTLWMKEWGWPSRKLVLTEIPPLHAAEAH